jgi:hypothetical protein
MFSVIVAPSWIDHGLEKREVALLSVTGGDPNPWGPNFRKRLDRADVGETNPVALDSQQKPEHREDTRPRRSSASVSDQYPAASRARVLR